MTLRAAVRRPLMVLLLVVGGGLGLPSPGLAAPSPGTYLAGPFTTKTVARFTRDLAHVGIAVSRPNARRPQVRVRGRVSPVRLTTDDARSAASGAWSHAGMSGAQINAVMGPVQVSGELSLPAGAIVAGWAKGARSPSARLARRILGAQDWSRYESIVFPHAVLLLYASDTALHLTRPTAKAAPTTRAAPATAAGLERPCTAARDFVKNTINGVFDAIGHIKTDHAAIDRLFGKGWLGDIVKGIGDVLSQTVNGVVDSARKIVIGVTEIPVQLITNAIAGVAGTVSVIGQVANSLLPWKGSLRASPIPTAKGVGTGIPGSFTLDVTAPGSDRQWAPWVVDCAGAFKFELPTFTPKDAPVTWDIEQGPGTLIVTTTNTGPLDARGTAQQAYVTATETPDEATGTPATGYVNVIAKVHREDLDKLIHAVTNGLLGLLPGIVQNTIGAQIRKVVTPMVQSLTANIDKVRDVQADVVLPVSYHQPKEPEKPPPAPVPAPTGIAGHWNGNWVGEGGGTFTVDFVQSDTTFTGTIAISGSVCVHGGAITGTINGNQITFGVVSAEETISYTGTLSGNTMAGSWTKAAQADPCSATGGTWSATRG